MAAHSSLLLHVTTSDMSLELLLGPQLRAFKAAGYDVHANVKAVTGVSELRDMFAKFSHRAPNIVLSDYRLPDGATGDDVIALVDEVFPWATIPIVIYTADISPELRRRRDHVYVLAKSSDPMPLLSLMQRAIWAAKQADCGEVRLAVVSARGRT